MEDRIMNKLNNAEQLEILGSELLTCDPYCFMPYRSVEDFNEKEAGRMIQEQKPDESFFGENIKEATTVLKDMFKR